ncbi:MAG TPA: hypothetical protein VN635_04265 [Conexibacter sp.]|nr:hypothetical protein [Conexibacter sp.]
MTFRLRLSLALLVVAIAAAAGFAAAGCGASAKPIVLAPLPAGAPPLKLGVVADTLDDRGSARPKDERRVRALGVRWVREELRWPDVEPRPGVFRWGQFDRLLSDSARRGLHVLPLLIGTPRWTGGTYYAMPDPQEFGAFAARVAARYAPGGSFWRTRRRLAGYAPQWFELWNEPYTARYSAGGVDPVRYAQMVRATLTQGRAANPRARWLMAADLDYNDNSGRGHDWLGAIAAADPTLAADVDGVAVHPYAFVAPTDHTNDTQLRYRFDRTAAIERELIQHGKANPVLWITELGFSTCNLRPDCTSEHDQAQWLADVGAALRRAPLIGHVQALFVYHLRDFPRAGGSDREGHYGLLRTNGSHKPAWSVLRALTLQRPQALPKLPAAPRRAPRGSSRSAR